jgi:hypothetical protein
LVCAQPDGAERIEAVERVRVDAQAPLGARDRFGGLAHGRKHLCGFEMWLGICRIQKRRGVDLAERGVVLLLCRIGLAEIEMRFIGADIALDEILQQRGRLRGLAFREQAQRAIESRAIRNVVLEAVLGVIATCR